MITSRETCMRIYNDANTTAPKDCRCDKSIGRSNIYMNYAPASCRTGQQYGLINGNIWYIGPIETKSSCRSASKIYMTTATKTSPPTACSSSKHYVAEKDNIGVNIWTLKTKPPPPPSIDNDGPTPRRPFLNPFAPLNPKNPLQKPVVQTPSLPSVDTKPKVEEEIPKDVSEQSVVPQIYNQQQLLLTQVPTTPGIDIAVYVIVILTIIMIMYALFRTLS